MCDSKECEKCYYRVRYNIAVSSFFDMIRELNEDRETEVRDETLVSTSQMNEQIGYEIPPLLTFDLFGNHLCQTKWV